MRLEISVFPMAAILSDNEFVDTKMVNNIVIWEQELPTVALNMPFDCMQLC